MTLDRAPEYFAGWLRLYPPDAPTAPLSAPVVRALARRDDEGRPVPGRYPERYPERTSARGKIKYRLAGLITS